jgi:hypothetical protein
MSLNDRAEQRAGDGPRGWVVRGVFVGSALSTLAAIATWSTHSSVAPSHVHAAAPIKNDTDGDGLPDDLELLLGSNPGLVDTDGDGYSDAEELARGSALNRVISQPTPQAVALSMHGYLRANWIHALTAIYLDDGDLHSRTFEMGVRIGDQLVPIPLQSFRGGNVVCVLSGAAPGSCVLVVDPVVSSGSVCQLGSMSMYATLAYQGQNIAAAALNLRAVDGEFFEHVITRFREASATTNFAFGSGIKGVYKPLTAGPGPQPIQSTPGQICAQTTVVVGVMGAVVTEEVVAADCVPGWDAHCSGGCAATIGSTVKFIDPGALVGN